MARPRATQAAAQNRLLAPVQHQGRILSQSRALTRQRARQAATALTAAKLAPAVQRHLQALAQRLRTILSQARIQTITHISAKSILMTVSLRISVAMTNCTHYWCQNVEESHQNFIAMQTRMMQTIGSGANGMRQHKNSEILPTE